MSAIFKIISFTGQFWRWYVAMAAFVIATSLLSLATPLLGKQIVDQIVARTTGQPTNFQTILILLGLVIAADIISTVLTALGQWIGDILAVKLQTFLSTSFYKHLLDLHIGYYDNEVTGNTVNKMYRGIESISGFIQSMLNNFLPFFLTAIITIVLLGFYSWAIAIMLAILFPIYIAISHGSTLAWKKFQDQQNSLADHSQGRVFESISGIRIVKAFATELQELANFSTARTAIEGLAVKQTRGWHAYDFARRIALNLILFGIYSYIIYYTFHGRYSLGEMTLLLALVQQARFPLFAMSFILSQIQQAEAGSKDFFKVLETPAAIPDHPQATTMVWPQHQPTPLITFNQVNFGYEVGKSVLHDMSFSINPHQKFALVGESGQGKSTLINLLLRFYDPQAGTIDIAGQNIAHVTQTSLRQQIAVVFQESLLFSGTILENIRYARPEASQAEVEEAALAANAHQFISDLPEGYNSLVGERGVKLSGGQKQRISIARAMLKNAPIIILDEATSALDSKSEVLVQEGLEHLMEGRTSIIIAHRLSTIANADQILVVSEGTVGEIGSPEDLLKNPDGLYTQLVSLQQQLLRAPTQAKRSKLKQYDLVA